jgi:hypothetical protein
MKVETYVSEIKVTTRPVSSQKDLRSDIPSTAYNIFRGKLGSGFNPVRRAIQNTLVK